MIFVEEYEYLPLMTEAGGAQIVIHNQTTMPFPDQRAISVTSNSLVNIGVRKVHSYHQYYKEYKHSLRTKPTKWAGLYLFWCCGCLKGVGLEVSGSSSIAVLELKSSTYVLSLPKQTTTPKQKQSSSVGLIPRLRL